MENEKTAPTVLLCCTILHKNFLRCSPQRYIKSVDQYLYFDP